MAEPSPVSVDASEGDVQAVVAAIERVDEAMNFPRLAHLGPIKPVPRQDRARQRAPAAQGLSAVVSTRHGGHRQEELSPLRRIPDLQETGSPSPAPSARTRNILGRAAQEDEEDRQDGASGVRSGSSSRAGRCSGILSALPLSFALKNDSNHERISLPNIITDEKNTHLSRLVFKKSIQKYNFLSPKKKDKLFIVAW